MSSDGNSSGVGCVDGGTGVPFSNALRRRPFGVLRATVFRPAVLRPAVLRAPVLRPMVFRAAVLRAPVLRAAALRVAALRRVVRRAPVLRGRPGLRLLAINPSVMLVRDVRRWISYFL